MRKRLRELGYTVGRLPAGPGCSLVDVPGVRVGHLTLREGDSVRTGVTAVLPHGGNLYAEKVPAACHVINGYGKATGLTQVQELGTLESPVLLTNTLAVGAVWEGGLRHVLEQNPEAGRDGDTVNVVVGECFDGWLSDARSLPVRPEHALEAIAAASEDAPEEGAVGAGTGTTCFGFKAGVGGSSRSVAGGFTLGCLVVSNYGARRDLHMLVGPDAAQVASGGQAADPGGGSIMIVLGTDAPLSDRQLRRVAARATFGLARAGSFASSGSGEYAIAFSTAYRVPHRAEASTLGLQLLRDDSPELRELFEAAGEATQEAILNSLCAAGPMDGRDGRRAEGFPYDLLPAVHGVSRF
ncbi:MAG TPA: P1 family peptidase [Thermoleophilaceae bacterium]|nr:P1 family peptidase [Thermoleophilaceae bacterium]